MCGIVGYIGGQEAKPILLEGLRKLEYRGYDSAGIALWTPAGLDIRKKTGKVADLISAAQLETVSSSLGIGHTRWATHGIPSDRNAHPHTDAEGKIAIIHNGVIENYSALKQYLENKGVLFRSETDTEVLAHLISAHYRRIGSLEDSVRLALHEVEGTYGIAVVCSDEPEKLVVARNGSPLVIGHGDGEYFVASDASALIRHTRTVTYLEDKEIAVITRSAISVKTLDDTLIAKESEELTFDVEQIEKGGYPHFMLKEIFNQPESISNSMRGRLLTESGDAKLGGLESVTERLTNARRFVITACGTSWHAALIGKHMLEQYVRIPVEVDYASEFRYRNPIINRDDIVWVISQSGETADTLAAMREGKAKGALVLGICNVVGSTIARETDAGVYIHAGPEIGVASTKAFTSQLTVLALITLFLMRRRGLHDARGTHIVSHMQKLPEKVAEILAKAAEIERIAELFKESRNFLYLGRGYNFPAALEGALKLKEISYIHAEGYPAAEMKHGPIALIDEKMPVVCIAPQDSTYEKILSNIQEVKARKGVVIAIVNKKEPVIEKLADHLIVVPETLDFLTPILTTVPLQLLAYYIAHRRGCDVDQPRNLAKSVTVE